MKKYLLYLLLLTAFCSCDDFLDQKPKTQVDATYMFKTEQGFKDALTSCYVKMAGNTLYGKQLTATTIEVMAQHWDLDASNFGSELGLKELDFTTTYSRELFSGIYGALYNVVVQANDVLKNLAQTGSVINLEQTRQVIEAEALAVRAFIHIDVLRLFGEMPQNAQKKVSLAYAETVGKQEIMFYDFDKYVEKIFTDLDRAEEILAKWDPLLVNTLEASDGAQNVEDAFLAYRRYRFNLYAVKALKARFYLYLGNKAKAYEYANSVITGATDSGEPMITLTGDEDVKKGYYAMPTESLMLLSKSNISNDLFSTTSFRISKTTFDAMFAENQSEDCRALLVWDRTAQDAGGKIIPLLRKYKQPGTESGINATTVMLKYQVIPLFRLAEMYLIAMECTTSDKEANTLYKQYMKSRRIIVEKELSRTELDEEIEKEYRRELFAEGQMFYYYKRHATPRILWQVGASDLTETNYIVPLPESELKQ